MKVIRDVERLNNFGSGLRCCMDSVPPVKGLRLGGMLYLSGLARQFFNGAFEMKNKNLLVSMFAGAGLLVAGSSFAVSAYDVTGVTAAMTDATGQILVVGAAGLLVAVGIKVYKWIRRAL